MLAFIHTGLRFKCDEDIESVMLTLHASQLPSERCQIDMNEYRIFFERVPEPIDTFCIYYKSG